MSYEKTEYFDATTDYYKLEEESEDVLLKRRIQTYSTHALKLGLRVDSIVVLSTQFVEGLKALDRVFQMAREVKMPHGFRLVGPPGSGKSTLIRYFSESLPPSNLFMPSLGCMGVRAAAKSTTGQLIASLLAIYKYPFISQNYKTVYLRKELLFELIREKGTRLIYVEDAHQLLKTSSKRQGIALEPDVTAFLSEMMDETNVGLVLMGDKSLDQLETIDKSLADRIAAKIEMLHFEPNNQWRGVLIGFSKDCSWFDVKIIEDVICAKNLHHATGGNLRQFKRLLTEAVLIAAQVNESAISNESLKNAFSVVFGKQSSRTNPFV